MSAIFLLSTFYGNAPMNVQTEHVFGTAPMAPQAEVINQPLTLEQYVRAYYKDTPVLAEIAKCESHFRQFGVNGKVLRGEVVAEDVGVMQVNEFYHEDTAKALGLDLHTLDGNLAYAKWLYAREGSVPWYSSSKCWEKSQNIAKTDTKLATNTN